MVRKPRHVVKISRRTIVAGAAILLTARAVARPAIAELAGERSRSFQEAYARIVGDRTPEAGAFTMELPELAENGNMVLFKLSAESPMTEAEHVRALHLLSTQNPQGHVATFKLSLLSGAARVSGRMRLAKTQDVVALAELSDGRILMASSTVQVTIGGCGI
ncbi:MAG: thiosulfate oxidation carrier protein SoxY [Hyphomicrobiaceae bacterium]|nr:thiosulfate oxidation carrier protein SoxY [Hyphomicrobiaceae bacterium]